MRHLLSLGTIMLFATLLLLPLSYAGGTLSCGVNATGTTLLRISNSSNAHAELPNQTGYSYLLTCRDTGPASLTISTTGTEFFKLSNYTNAHAEKSTQSNYNHSASMGATNGTVSIAYRTTCKDLETCIATIPSISDTNLHVADCSTDPYSTKVCARLDYNENVACTSNDHCLGGICDGGKCVAPTIKIVGRVIFWENSSPVASASVLSRLLQDNLVLDQKSATSDAEGDYELAFDVRGKQGEIYVVNTTITKGSFSTHVTRKFLVELI